MRLQKRMMKISHEQYLDGLIQHLKQYPNMELQYINFAQKTLKLCDDAIQTLYLFTKEEYKNPMFYEGMKQQTSDILQEIIQPQFDFLSFAPVELLGRKLCDELTWLTNQIPQITEEQKDELYELLVEKINEAKVKLNYFIENINKTLTEDEKSDVIFDSIQNNKQIEYKPFRNGLKLV